MKFPSNKTLLILFLIVVVIIGAYCLGFGDFLSLPELQKHNNYFKQCVANHYFASILVYVGIFTMVMACGLPIAMPLAMLGGFLYGKLLGLILAMISCLIGSVISYLVLRYVVVRWIEHWHNDRIERLHVQLQKYGYSYLLVLYFLSVVPMFVINLLAAIANVPVATVAGITLIGTLPFNLICVIAGQQLSTITSFKDIFSPTILVLFAILILIACLPIFLKKIKGSFGV
jgi:uncharacterized membrane protein YdjX (TVP38/TMEM64 family)